MCLLAVCSYRKALDNNDLNQVCLTRGFVKRRVYWGGVAGGGGGGGGAQSRRLIKLGSHLRIFVSKWRRSKLLNASAIRLCPLASHRCRGSCGSTGISQWT